MLIVDQVEKTFYPGTVNEKRALNGVSLTLEDGDFATAGFWVIVVLLISFGIIFLVNLVTGSRMKNIKRW